MACAKGNQLLGGDLNAVLDKVEADILHTEIFLEQENNSN